MGQRIYDGWIVAHGRIVWGASRKSADDARADARQNFCWSFGEKLTGAPAASALEVHPASSELLALLDEHGGGEELGPWHVGEGGIAQPGAGSQRELFAQEASASVA